MFIYLFTHGSASSWSLHVYLSLYVEELTGSTKRGLLLMKLVSTTLTHYLVHGCESTSYSYANRDLNLLYLYLGDAVINAKHAIDAVG